MEESLESNTTDWNEDTSDGYDTMDESMQSDSSDEDGGTRDGGGTATDFSIPAVMHILCNLPGLDVGSDMFIYAMSILEVAARRQILTLIPSDKARLSYIKSLYSEHQAGMDSKTMGPPRQMYKEPQMTSDQTGEIWLMKLTGGDEQRCFNLFRMEHATFRKLSRELGSKYGLKPSGRVSILEKVGLFVYALGKGASHKDVQERFHYSAEIVNTAFREVLLAVTELSVPLLEPKDPEFEQIPPQIANNDKYMPHFKDCIGVVDCHHIPVTVPVDEQRVYRGRKKTTTTNVIVACDFDLQFTYVMVGWEGSAHDSRVFRDAIYSNRHKSSFPHPPSGKYYLVDKNFPETQGYLTPYRRARYGLSEFKRASPRVSQEIFNQEHSSLSSCMERTLSVLKARWKILQHWPGLTIEKQLSFMLAAFGLHNFIRRNSITDQGFKEVDRALEFIQPDVFPDANSHSLQQGLKAKRVHPMTAIRDEIASSLVTACHQTQNRS